MANTTFTGPVISTNGFVGAFTGGTTNLALTGTLSVDGASTLTGAVTAPAGITGDVTGNVTGNATGALNGVLGGVTPAAATVTTLTSSGAVVGGVQALSGAGAVNVTSLTTALTTTGAAQALTLANGTLGQVKNIAHTVDGGSGVLTPTTKIGFSTITFTAVGDSCSLVYTATGWAIVGLFGAVAA